MATSRVNTYTAPVLLTENDTADASLEGRKPAELYNTTSTPGQNVHLVLPHNHVVVSSSHLANSSSQLVLSASLSQSVVELSRRVVESSRRVVFFDLLSRCAITRLFFNSSYYLSTRHVAFQLFVQRSRALFLEKEGT